MVSKDPQIINTVLSFFYMVGGKTSASDKTAGDLSGLENSEVLCLVATMLDLDHPEWVTVNKSILIYPYLFLCSLPGL